METWAGPEPFAAILAAARAGDEDAFARLWRWAHPALLRWLRVVAPDAAEDVASDVWVSVIRCLGSFDGGERDFRAWFFTIARHRAIDFARYRRRRPQTVTLEGIDAPHPLDLGEALAGEAAVETAVGVLRRMRPEHAEVVALRVVAGLTVAETSAVVSRSDAAVRLLCHRGLRMLARSVGAGLVPEGQR